VLCEVGVDEFGECEPSCDPLLALFPLEFTFERVAGVLFRREPAALDTLGAAATGSIAVCP
jgi:hypothetical protein